MAKYSMGYKNGDSGFDSIEKDCDIILFEAIPNEIGFGVRFIFRFV